MQLSIFDFPTQFLRFVFTARANALTVGGIKWTRTTDLTLIRRVL